MSNIEISHNTNERSLKKQPICSALRDYLQDDLQIISKMVLMLITENSNRLWNGDVIGFRRFRYKWKILLADVIDDSAFLWVFLLYSL